MVAAEEQNPFVQLDSNSNACCFRYILKKTVVECKSIF